MIDYKKELNEEQLRVVENGDGAALVLAGAGSGKTRTITYRIAYLLEKGVDPNEILLVTFTNKAAREMKERIEKLLMNFDGKTKISWNGTFHHIGFRILRQYAELLGYRQNFTILDSEDSRNILKMCIKEEGVQTGKNRFPSPKVLTSLISFARNALLPLDKVLENKYPQWQHQEEMISRIAAEYRNKKKLANAMDFDDLLSNTVLLFDKFPSVKEKFASRFKYVFVDEYQDTNKVQARMVDQMSSVHKNLLVVGDDAQSIYSFRAADIDNILSFEHKYENAKLFRLETNYRSTPNILDLANAIIENNTDQYPKNLKSTKEYAVSPELHTFAESSDEGEFVAGKIEELIDEGEKLNSIAVLFRASHHSQSLEVALTRKGIPYDYRGGVRFFERSHIKDVLAFLKIIENISDRMAWQRVLLMQDGVGPATAEKIIDKALELGVEDGYEQIYEKLSSRAKVGWRNFYKIYEKLKEVEANEETGKPIPSELIGAVLDSEYIDYLQNEFDNYRDRVQDIEQLAFFAEKEKDLGKFLGEAAMQESFQNLVKKEEEAHGEEDKIVLSTIHQAKGLEWNTVFVLHMAAGEFPNMRALSEHKGKEEERRLFYVAVTRAKKLLFLSYPLVTGFGNVLGGPSPFVEEVPQDLLDHRNSFDEGSGENAWDFSDLNDEDAEVEYVSEDKEWGNHARRKRSFLKDVDEL